MSEQKFPPRVWIWFYEENHASKRKGIREAHKCTPHGGKLQPEPTHISIQEHQHLMDENERRIERLREALKFYADQQNYIDQVCCGMAVQISETEQSCCGEPVTSMLFDNGNMARAALQEEGK